MLRNSEKTDLICIAECSWHVTPFVTNFYDLLMTTHIEGKLEIRGAWWPRNGDYL